MREGFGVAGREGGGRGSALGSPWRLDVCQGGREVVVVIVVAEISCKCLRK